MRTYSDAELNTKISAFLKRKGVKTIESQQRDVDEMSDSRNIEKDGEQQRSLFNRIVTLFVSSNSAQAR